MSTIISVGTTTATGFKVTPDTSGNLAFQTQAGANTITVPNVTGTLLTNKTAGTVLQVVNAVLTTGASSSTSSFADTGLSATITPTSSTNKILVIVTHGGLAKNVNDAYLALQLLRGSTFLVKLEGAAGYTGGASTNYVSGSGCTYLDSPATTSATTYKTQFASANNNAQATFGTNGASATITLMEIAA